MSLWRNTKCFLLFCHLPRRQNRKLPLSPWSMACKGKSRNSNKWWWFLDLDLILLRHLNVFFFQGPLILHVSVKMYPLQLHLYLRTICILPKKGGQDMTSFFTIWVISSRLLFPRKLSWENSRLNWNMELQFFGFYWKNPKHLHFLWCWQSGTGRIKGFMHREGGSYF